MLRVWPESGHINENVIGVITRYNESGQASGHRGRCFYVIIKNTAYFPDERAVGAGRVHFYPIEQVLGSEIEKQRVLCGGFAYHNGTLKFSSIWLNQNDQIGIGGSMAQTDDSKYLTDPEQVIVKYCFDQYKSHGSNITFTIPAHIERQIC